MEIELDHETYLQMHIDSMLRNLEKIGQNASQFSIPHTPRKYLANLAKEVDELFSSEPSMLSLTGPICIVGDLHGQLFDLYRIFQVYNLPPYTSYLFLGDLVDRGEFSIETLSFVYVLKVLFPNNIYLIRGNHEFRSTTIDGGLFAEVEKLYPRSNVFDILIDSFKNIPLSALINNQILCIHGGVSPGLSKLSQLQTIERPIADFNDPIVCGLLWSDPSQTVDKFMPSPRGTGFLFGSRAVEKFLSHNQIQCIVRGHECIKEGLISVFDNKVLTVFSASNYCGVTENKSAVIVIDASSYFYHKQFQPLPYIKRTQINYHQNDVNNTSLTKTVHPIIARIPRNSKPNCLSVTFNSKPNGPLDNAPKRELVILRSKAKIRKITRRRTLDFSVKPNHFASIPNSISFDRA